MMERSEIFSNKINLKQSNKHLGYFITLIQTTYRPFPLSSERLLNISLEFIQEFNGSTQNEQIRLLSNVSNPSELWHFLSLNSPAYDCQTFLEELYLLSSSSLRVKQHLAFHVEDFLLTLSVSFDDQLRFACFQILALLIDHSHPQSKETIRHFNRLCYERLYDFDVYYEYIKSLTIQSTIVELTKEDLVHLLGGQCIRTDLEEEINEKIKELGGYVFFKMHRSPKDAYQNVSREINGQWSRLWTFKADEYTQSYFLRIENIDQLSLVFRNSDRLREDFEEYPSNEKLILRKWIDHIPNEYRCFICHGKLNAVSSYGQNKDPINNEKETIAFINSQSFRDILLSIPYNHGVVDCSIDPTNFQVQIIEINPFSKRSSSANYSWIVDRDILYSYYDRHGCVSVRLSNRRNSFS